MGSPSSSLGSKIVPRRGYHHGVVESGAAKVGPTTSTYSLPGTNARPLGGPHIAIIHVYHLPPPLPLRDQFGGTIKQSAMARRLPLKAERPDTLAPECLGVVAVSTQVPWAREMGTAQHDRDATPSILKMSFEGRSFFRSSGALFAD